MKKASKIEELAKNVVSCMLIVTVKVYFVCEQTGTMCVRLWHISRKTLLNSQNIKSIGLSTNPKDRKAEQ